MPVMNNRVSGQDNRSELSEDEQILREAKDRFKICQEWESKFQVLFKDDTKFYHGDSDNGWQWPSGTRQERDTNHRPSLTINKTRTKVNVIVNDAYMNKPGVAIKPVGDQTSFKAAQTYENVVRQIEYVSKAQTVYDDAMRSAVIGGIGWWRVGTRYVPDDDRTFDQEIVIEPVRNHLGCYLDPNMLKRDGSDAMYGFVFDEINKDEAKRKYGDDVVVQLPAVSGPDTWIMTENIRVAEYYRIVETDDELIYAEDAAGNSDTFLRSEVPGSVKQWDKLLAAAERDGGIVKRRPIKHKRLEWFKIVGDKIVDRRAGNKAYKFRYVPLVRVVGIEDVVDGELVRYGHVRALKDPQRMYNYNSSGQVEFGALATKIPFIGPKAAFAGNESMWNNANVQNFAYLTYNHVDGDGQPIPKPERTEAPGQSPAFIYGMDRADKEMDMVTGQYEATDGRQGNERSGKAIAERQRQGDTATYHFINSQAIAIQYTGVIILDMFPHVYDTKRVIQIMGRDGQQTNVTLDPQQAEALVEQQAQDNKDVLEVIFNPSVGKYMVQADVGPSYSTARQEAWNAFVQLVGVNPDLYNEIGDLMFRSADFPLADKIAERLTRKIRTEKPYLFDDQAPTPQQQAMQQQIQELSKEVEALMHSLAKKDLQLTGKQQMRDVEAYDAESKRITALSNAYPELKHLGILNELDMLLMQTLQQMRGNDITENVEELGGQIDGDEPIEIPDFLNPNAASKGGEDDMPPVQGAQKAGDGNWYVPDPERPGKYLRID